MSKNQRKRLSAIYYMKNNRKRTAVLILSLGLFVTMVYGVSYLLSTTTASAHNIKVVGTKKMQLILPSTEVLDIDWSLLSNEHPWQEQRAEINRGLTKMGNQIKTLLPTEYVFPCTILNLNLPLIIGQLRYDAVLVTPEVIPILMDYMDAHLKEGVIPTQPGELIIDSRLAKILKVGISDKLYTDLSIVGIAESDTYFACGVDNNIYSSYGIAFLADGSKSDYLATCESLGYAPEKLWVIDHPGEKASYERDFENTIAFSSNLITLLSATMLFICLIVVFNMYIHDRHEEWCLYHSIGYSSKDIYLLACRELLITFLIALGFAVLLNTAFIALANHLLIAPMGLMATEIMPEIMLKIIYLLTALFGLLQMPIASAIHRIRTIDAIIEEAL